MVSDPEHRRWWRMAGATFLGDGVSGLPPHRLRAGISAPCRGAYRLTCVRFIAKCASPISIGETPLGDSVVYSTFATAATATKVFPMSKVVLVRRSHSLPSQPFLCLAECGENLRPHCPNDRRAHSIAQLLVAVGGGDLVSRQREFEIVAKAHLCR